MRGGGSTEERGGVKDLPQGVGGRGGGGQGSAEERGELPREGETRRVCPQVCACVRGDVWGEERR